LPKLNSFRASWKQGVYILNYFYLTLFLSLFSNWGAIPLHIFLTKFVPQIRSENMKETKDCNIKVRVTAEEKEKIKKYAEKLGVKMSEAIRIILNKNIK
jgi:hypothetical protein